MASGSNGNPQYVTYKSEQTALPRTPHSARREQEDEVDFLQNEPLLGADASPPPQGRTKRQAVRSSEPPPRARVRASRTPSRAVRGQQKAGGLGLPIGLVAGVVVACGILFLIGITVRKPDALSQFFSNSTESTSAHEALLEKPPPTVQSKPHPPASHIQPSTAAPARPSSADNVQPSVPAHEQASASDKSHAAPAKGPATGAHTPMTIDYSNYTSFPLTSPEYAAECWKVVKLGHKHALFWDVPAMGILDVPHPDQATVHHGSIGETHAPPTKTGAVCSSTITYMLDGNAGLAADLALMAQTAAFARERNRTFFVMDQFWNRGKWTDYFVDVRQAQPGPEPGCSAPPPEEYVACPRLARHWIVSPLTAKFHFGHEFAETFEDASSAGLTRQKPIFDRALQSFHSAIRPNPATVKLMEMALSEVLDDVHDYLGVHIRRGDLKAMAWKHHTGYIPLDDFVDGIVATQHKLVQDEIITAADVPALWVASDTSDAVEEFAHADGLPPGTRMFSLAGSRHAQLRALAPPLGSAGYVQREWADAPEEARVLLTRGAVVDLAMLSGLWRDQGLPLGTVCTIGSNICRLAAIGLRWEWALEHKFWVDVDMKGQIEPEWEAFRVFQW